MAIYYYRLDVGGFIPGVPPSPEPIIVGGVQLRANKYDYHIGGLTPEGYFIFRVAGMSATPPDDYHTATIDLDHGNVDHEPVKAWRTIYIEDPEYDIPSDLDQTSMSGDFRNLDEEGTKVGFSGLELNSVLGLVGTRTIADYADAAKDIAVVLAGRRMGLPLEQIEDLKNRIDNAVIIRDALTAVQKGGIDFLGSVADSIVDFDAASGDGRAFDDKLDALILGAQDKALEAARDTQTFSDPVLEAAFDVALGAATLVYTLGRDGALGLNLSAAMELGPATADGVTIRVTGTGSTDFVMDGTGSAWIEAGDGNDIVSAGGGADTVSGGGGNDYLHGGADADIISGGDGSDHLNGGTGTDDMAGGSGDDVYVVDRGSDVVREVAGAGTDRVESNATYSLGAAVEDLVLTGIAGVGGTGNALDNRITGNIARNTLSGGGGNDVLDGGGAADTMRGGTGDDLYVVDHAGDLALELPGSGLDRVSASVTFALGADMEELVLVGTSAIAGTGNALNNVITGNDGANLLEGAAGADRLTGGLGVDELLGGDGDDIYFVTGDGDRVVEASAGGYDGVVSSASFVLGSHIEQLTLSGAAAINATGNGLSNHLVGNDAANVLNGAGGADRMEGGAGNDTYAVDDASDHVVEAATAGTDIVRSSVSYTLGVHLETLVLAGEAFLHGTGNALVNELVGNAGANRLDGGGGNDVMRGGQGDDTYVVAQPGDTVVELAGGGTDRVETLVSHRLADNVENLTLSGTAAIGGTGNALDNVITGNDAANRLDGGAGGDRMVGGLGDDVYHVDDAGDRLSDTGGTDTVVSAIAFALAAVMENLTLTGAAASGTGNGLDNVISGNALANSLNGAGGADTLAGAGGDDTYIVDNTLDRIVEAAGGGSDLVRSSLDWTLSANVERLELVGAALNGTGNGLDNVITGTAAANRLDGRAGADILRGGAGDDVYMADASFDRAVETADGGRDTVRSQASYRLDDHVEALALTGTAAIDGTGNDLDNVITGNDAANRLDGGAGADRMAGGLGNDTYHVDDQGDRLSDTGGTDTVVSAIAFVLAGWVENLTLTGSAASGTGNGLDNVISGNALANRLDGAGGADTMAGAGGDDTYVVDNGLDRIVEAAGGGSDLVRSSVDFTLSASVERLELVGAALNGTGNDLANVISGNAAANRLDGRAGADTLRGGAGDDVYMVDAGADRAVETAGGGRDTVRSQASYRLGAHVELLALTGAAAIDGTGNNLDNVITGNDAANRLDGGAGADRLLGGSGDDTYIVGAADDIVTENADRGFDTVRVAFTYRLGLHVEALALTGTDAIDGSGNGLDNVIAGNAAANVLNGGAGADRLFGGDGDDLYIVDSEGDAASESSASGGLDTVRSSASHRLGAYVEVLALTGSAEIDGTGNALDNLITGNQAANLLNGGAGADRLRGGSGDDTYVVDMPGDIVTEFGVADGFDTVRSAISYRLGSHLEALALTGAEAIDGTGNDLDNVITGNGAANWLNGGAGADRLSGGNGDDTYVVDAAGDVASEGSAMGGNDTVRSSASHRLGAYVESLLLTGSEAIDGTGNGLDNVITGNGAANVLNGGAGADRLWGGNGDDIYIVDMAGDVAVETSAGGRDTVRSSASHRLAAHVEQLALTGTAEIDGTGNGLDNVITGNGAANLLNGGAGADRLEGGHGDDIYIVDSAGDVVVEGSDTGRDTVRSAISYELGAFVEALALSGAALEGRGNGLDNVLTGNAGDNLLDGAEGADRLQGGDGNDTYIVDHDVDRVIESSAAGGTDTVRSRVSFALGAELETLVLLDTAIAGTGNDGRNSLFGNDEENLLEGRGGEDLLDGGAGADRLEGGSGSDTYRVDDAADEIYELAGDLGTDVARAWVSYVLSEGIEDLILEGDGAIDGTGNSGVNRIEGNAGDNVLDGREGADQLFGGTGDDTYVVDGTDMISDTGGFDTAISSAEESGFSSGIERLVLAGAAHVARGNLGNNIIVGSDGDNQIFGQGGIDQLYGGAGKDFIASATSEVGDLAGDMLDGGNGNDLLVGSNGNDLFHGGAGNDQIILGFGADKIFFDTALNSASNVDDIGSFEAKDDHIVLDRAIFTGLAPGAVLTDAAFRLGTSAADSSDRIICDGTTGRLFYDADGTGALPQVQIAILTGVRDLPSAATFEIIG